MADSSEDQHAKTKNTQRRGQALQEDGNRKSEAPQSVLAPHPHLEGEEAQEAARQFSAGQRRRYAQSKENDSVLAVWRGHSCPRDGRDARRSTCTASEEAHPASSR